MKEANQISRPSSRVFLGPTSYSAVFRENLVEISENEKAFNGLITSDDSDSDGSCNLKAPQHIAQGIEILNRFPERRLSQILLDRYFEVCHPLIHEPTIRYCHENIWVTQADSLSPLKDPGSVLKTAELLCTNAMLPTPPPCSTNDWLASYTSARLRWEVIGNMFAIFGIAAMSLSDWHPLFNDSQESNLRNKRRYSGTMRKCAEGCLGLGNDVDTVNEFVISLMANVNSLQSFHDGDTSQQLWRRHGEMASAVTAAGLHREPDPSYLPATSNAFLVAEYRRRLFCYFFAIDKLLSTFMGRPPALGRRYATCKMPLDLTDEQMMADGESLAAFKERLDPDGWNTDGIISPNTVFRAWMNLSVIRDEILELALGPPSDNLSVRREELKQKSGRSYSQMPLVLQYRVGSSNQKGMSPSRFSLQTTFYQEQLVDNFLLNRMPDGGSWEVKQDLVDTARKMLDLVLELSANRDRLKDYTLNFVWAISYSGIPSAGVLGVELLRQSKFPGDVHTYLPRSETIQNLSVFLGCLEWVRPSEGNHMLCVRMHKAIKRILDEVLELPPPSMVNQESASLTSAELPISSLFGTEEDPDFLNWLNSGDWTRDILQDPWT